MTKLVDLNPEDTDFRLQFGLGLTVLGMLRVTASRESEAEDVLLRAISLLRPLVDGDGRVKTIPILAASTPMTLAQAYFYLALVYGDSERIPEAEAALVRFIELVGNQGQEIKTVPAPAMLLEGVSLVYPFALAMLGKIYRDSGRNQEAEIALARAVDQFDQRENDPAAQGILAEILETLSEIYELTGRARPAKEARTRCRVIRLTLGESEPDESCEGLDLGDAPRTGGAAAGPD